MMFLKFPSIESFHHKVKAGKKYFSGEMLYNIRPKLHGTNAGIVFHPKDSVYAQSRKRVITPDDDNMNFAKFVDSLGLSVSETQNNIFVVFGEWAGEGIQSKDAITKIGKKVFAPFAVVEYLPSGESAVRIYTNDGDVKNMLGVLGLEGHNDIVMIDTVDTIQINFSGDNLQEIADRLNDKIEVYEKVDTWVKEKFGVEGPGEGFVATPQTMDYDVFYNWTFKIKTTAHTVNKSSKSAVVAAEPSSDVVAFVDRFVTEPRLEQAVSELGGDDEMDMSKMGEFLKWMGQDIKKESGDELEASNLEWKNVSKLITNKSRMWFMNRYK